MHSNPRCELVSEAVSPASGKGRRGRPPAALARRRSPGGAGPITGTSGVELRTISAMGLSGLYVQDLSTSGPSRSYW
jgi:hypothetical protein